MLETKTTFDVCVECSFGHTTGFTMRTLIGSFTSMTTHVYSQRSTLVKAFSAIVTNIWLLTIVDSFMHNQVITLNKTLTAVYTGIGFLSSVFSVMNLQFVCSGESLPTYIAEVFLLMRTFVVGQVLAKHVLH